MTITLDSTDLEFDDDHSVRVLTLVKQDEWPQEYIQAAGDGRRLTAEVRGRDEAGGYGQSVIGRPEAASEIPTETVSWSRETRPAGHRVHGLQAPLG